MMAMDWHEVAKVGDISADTQTLRVVVSGQAICLYAIEAGICATQDRCPHGNASLAEGWVEDGKIECPLHQGVFDIVSGAPLGPPVDTPLALYPVKVEGNSVLIGLKADA